MKYLMILSLSMFCSSCAYLATHPQVVADLKQEGMDVAKDSEKVVEDIIETAPATPVVVPVTPAVTP